LPKSEPPTLLWAHLPPFDKVLGEKPSRPDELGFLPVKNGKAIVIDGVLALCEDGLRAKLGQGANRFFALFVRHGRNEMLRLHQISKVPFMARRSFSVFFKS
jgi:hypothetical protein